MAIVYFDAALFWGPLEVQIVYFVLTPFKSKKYFLQAIFFIPAKSQLNFTTYSFALKIFWSDFDDELKI